MIVYVESNFVLELAFLRDDHTSAQRILENGEAQRIRLLMPAFCGGEPYESMIRRAKDRRALQSRLDQEIRELSRSQPYIDVGTVSQDLTSILAKSADEEKSRLDAALLRIVQAAEIIPLPSVPISLETLSSNSLMSRAKENFNVSRLVIIIEVRESITTKG